MIRIPLITIFAFWILITITPISGQPKSQELSEDDGLPVLIKHLPNWQSVRDTTVFLTNQQSLIKHFGVKPVFNAFELAGGTEAATANYPAGRLLIVEFTNPQASADTDAKVLSELAASPDPKVLYRRIGNYNVFVFDVSDEEAAVKLIEEIRYQKTVQWLGEDPYLIEKFERYFVNMTRDVFIATVQWIVGGLAIATVCGLLIGFVFFRVRDNKRANWNRASDAGGITRLNLDGLSE